MGKELRPKCPVCDSAVIYVKKDGTIVCLRCGARTPNDFAATLPTRRQL